MAFGSIYGRKPIGLASSDLELRKLIPFKSTPETERFGRLAIGNGALSRAQGTPRALSREAEQQLPVSLTEQAVARLQEDGKMAFKQQDLLGAIEAWTEALAQVRTLPAPAPRKLESTRAAQLLANRCQAHLKLGQEAEALADAEAACDAAPGWPKAYYRLGTVLLEQGQLGRADAVLNQGLQLDTSNDEMRRVLYRVKELRLEQRDPATAPAGEATAAPESCNSANHGEVEFGPAVKPVEEGPEFGPANKR